jgi:hypothetical protein
MLQRNRKKQRPPFESSKLQLPKLLEQRRRSLRSNAPHQKSKPIATSERTGDLLVVMDTENLVPFRARWNIVTKKDRVVAGIMLEGHEIYPTDKQKRFTTKARISGAEVTDEYVELRFRYESIYSAELGNPPELRGEIVQRYRFKDNRVLPWE